MRISSLLVCLALLLAGCGSGPPERVLRLAPEGAPAAAQTPVLGGSLQVLSFNARGLLAEPRLAYVDWRSPGELLQYASIRWDEAPARTVEQALARHLRSANLAATVFAADNRAAGDYWLSGRLERFEQVIGRDGSSVAVKIDFSLLRARDRALTFAGTYCASAAMADAGPAAALPAFEAALGGLFDRLVDDLRRGASRPSGDGC